MVDSVKAICLKKTKKEIIYKDKNGHYGVEVGTVLRVKKGEVVYWRQKRFLIRMSLNSAMQRAKNCTSIRSKTAAFHPVEVTARYQKGCVIKPGQKVFRTKNAVLLQEIDEAVEQEKKEDKLPIQGTFQAEIGKEMRLQLSSGAVSCEVTGIQARPGQRESGFPQKMSASAFRRQGKVSLPFLLWKSRWKRGRSCRSGRSRRCAREGFAELGQKMKEKQLEKRRKIPTKRPETPARSKKTKKNICC